MEAATVPCEIIPEAAVQLGEEEAAPVGEKSEEEIPIRPLKKAKTTTANGEMRRVAEIVLVLSAMAGVRGGGGREPAEAEVKLMAEARARLAEVCRDFAPKDLVGREAVGAVIEDLGLNWKVKDQRLGFRGSSRLSIKERVALSNKRKMEDPKKFAAPSAIYPSQTSPSSFGPMAGSYGPANNVRISDKPSNVQSPSGVLPASPLGHVSASGPLSVMHNPITPEVRVPILSAGMTGSNLGRDLPASSFPRADKTQIKLEGAVSGTPFAPHAPQVQANVSVIQTPVTPSTWPMHPHSTSSAKSAVENKMTSHNPIKVEGTADSGASRMGSQAARDPTFKPTVTQAVSVHMPSIHQPVPMQGVKYVQPSVFINNHSEIAKIVQKVLQPKRPECPSWTPPSREYMSKALACQLCKLIVHEVETIVLCDSCEKGFHLKCLEANNQKGIPRAEWHCMKCLALSNGKPLPPKYGRVMRSITPPKGNANPPVAQPSLQKNEGAGQKVIREKATNGVCGSQGAAVSSQNNVETVDQKVNQEKPANGARGSQVLGVSGTVVTPPVQTADLTISNAKSVQGNSIMTAGNDGNLGTHAGTGSNDSAELLGAVCGSTAGSSNEKSLQQHEVSGSPKLGKESISESNFQSPVLSDKGGGECENIKFPRCSEDIARAEPSNTAEVPSTTCLDCSVAAEPGSTRGTDCTSIHDVDQNSQDIASGNPVQCPETSNGAKEPVGSSLNGFQNVEWKGNALRVVDGKTYYQSCCIGGVRYEIDEHALCHSSQDRPTPLKLQAMWEDNETGSKWVSVKKFYFPGDLPEDVGCPDSPESNEVYESNHEMSVMANLIQGPCKVLPPTKFRENNQGQNQSRDTGRSVFLCKWFYDEITQNFQRLSS